MRTENWKKRTGLNFLLPLFGGYCLFALSIAKCMQCCKLSPSSKSFFNLGNPASLPLFLTFETLTLYPVLFLEPVLYPSPPPSATNFLYFRCNKVIWQVPVIDNPDLFQWMKNRKFTKNHTNMPITRISPLGPTLG